MCHGTVRDPRKKTIRLHFSEDKGIESVRKSYRAYAYRGDKSIIKGGEFFVIFNTWRETWICNEPPTFFAIFIHDSWIYFLQYEWSIGRNTSVHVRGKNVMHVHFQNTQLTNTNDQRMRGRPRPTLLPRLSYQLLSLIIMKRIRAYALVGEIIQRQVNINQLTSGGRYLY